MAHYKCSAVQLCWLSCAVVLCAIAICTGCCLSCALVCWLSCAVVLCAIAICSRTGWVVHWCAGWAAMCCVQLQCALVCWFSCALVCWLQCTVVLVELGRIASQEPNRNCCFLLPLGLHYHLDKYTIQIQIWIWEVILGPSFLYNCRYKKTV